MAVDPRFAPHRTDLPWLRHRRLPRTAAAPEVAPERVHAAVTDFVTGHAPRRPSPPPSVAPPSVAPPVTPSVSSSLDLDAPVTPPPPIVRPPAVAPPASAPPTVAPASSSLDLDEPAPSSQPAAPPAPAAARAATPAARIRPGTRVRAGERHLLTVTDPTVTLTRLQSAIGTLSFEAAVGAAVGDLRIGCAYEMTTPDSAPVQSTVQLTQGNRLAPPRSRRPLLVAGHERFETIGVDLRQSPQLRRLIVYAFSESRKPLTWGGTLIATTFGGARVELPLESLQSGDSAVLMSLYNVRGEFVLRAEMQTLFGDVRECCRAYGFDRITWLDDRTPVE